VPAPVRTLVLDDESLQLVTFAVDPAPIDTHEAVLLLREQLFKFTIDVPAVVIGVVFMGSVRKKVLKYVLPEEDEWENVMAKLEVESLNTPVPEMVDAVREFPELNILLVLEFNVPAPEKSNQPIPVVPKSPSQLLMNIFELALEEVKLMPVLFVQLK
jgi:hypothetical protein